MVDRQQWLNNLKVGDEVFVKNQYHARICRITKMTPTRRMEVSEWASTKFDKSGNQMGESWNSLTIYPVTDEVRDQLKRNELISFFKYDLQWKTLKTQQLLDIMKIIQETK